jgi:hypothetical protein
MKDKVEIRSGLVVKVHEKIIEAVLKEDVSKI